MTCVNTTCSSRRMRSPAMHTRYNTRHIACHMHYMLHASQECGDENSVYRISS